MRKAVFPDLFALLRDGGRLCSERTAASLLPLAQSVPAAVRESQKSVCVCVCVCVYRTYVPFITSYPFPLFLHFFLLKTISVFCFNFCVHLGHGRWHCVLHGMAGQRSCGRGEGAADTPCGSCNICAWLL